MQITRVEGPKREGSRTRSMSEIKRIVLHHGATKQGLKGSNYLSYLSYHVNNLGWTIGGYAFGINDNGDILQGYELTDLTYHVGNYNRSSLGIVLAGDFRFEEPTPEQWAALYWLLDHLKALLPDAEIVGHSEVPGYSWKPCPSLDMEQIRKNAAAPKEDIEIKLEGVKQMVLRKGDKGPDVKTLQEHLNELGHNVGVADGHFGTKTENGVKSLQRAANILVDGVAGPQTLAKIEELLKRKNKVVAPKKEVVEFVLGGRKYRIEEA